MDTAKVIKRPRVRVHGPSDPQDAERLRRAIIAELAEYAVDLLYEGQLPTPSVKSSQGDG